MPERTTLADAGRKGGLSRARRLSPERLREIGRCAGLASAAQRRAKQRAVRQIALELMNGDPDLARLDQGDVERMVQVAMDLNLVLASVVEQPSTEGRLYAE